MFNFKRAVFLFAVLCWSVPAFAQVTYKGAGTWTFAAAACTAPMPTAGAAPAANDILLLVVESENQTIGLTTANGFAEVTNSPQGTGTAAAAGSNRIAVYWKRAAGSDASPVTTDSGDHQSCQIFGFSGVKTTGNPWNITAGGVEGTSDTSASIPGATTTVANTLVVLVQGTSNDANSTTNCGTPTNTDLGSLTERADNTSQTQGGGGFCVITGTKATAGAYAATTLTLTAATLKGMMSIALEPAPAVTCTAPCIVSLIRPASGAEGNTGFTTAAIDTTGANFIVIGVATYHNGTIVCSYTLADSKSNSYTALTQHYQSGGVVSTLHYKENATVGTGHTFTITMLDGCGAQTITVAAFSGMRTSGSFNQENGAAAAASSIATGSITPSESGTLIVSHLGQFCGATCSAYAVDNGLTITDQVAFLGSNNWGAAFAYSVQGAAAAINPTWSWTGSGDVAGASVASFNRGAGSSTGPKPGTTSMLGVGK